MIDWNDLNRKYSNAALNRNEFVIAEYDAAILNAAPHTQNVAEFYMLMKHALNHNNLIETMESERANENH